jgi:hypothetical protein
VGRGQVALEFEVLGCDRWMAAQVVAEGKVPAFLLLAEDAEMDVMCAGPFDWLLEEGVDRVATRISPPLRIWTLEVLVGWPTAALKARKLSNSDRQSFIWSNRTRRVSGERSESAARGCWAALLLPC